MMLVMLSACGSSNDSGGPVSPRQPVVSVCAAGSATDVSTSGTVSFDRVPHRVNNALDYDNIVIEPVRGAVVEIICQEDGLVVVSGETNESGEYKLSIPSDAGRVFVRVKAQMKKTGAPAWNFSLVDNTQNQALYVLDGSVFDPGVDPLIRNLHAASGWTGSAYTAVRAAAPFAILDTVYEAFNTVLQVEPNAVFPSLQLNWSKNNISVAGELALGQIGTSFFNGSEIYLLGAENVDTDEYDAHVIAHEFGHYLEEQFFRSDSIGGSHSSLSFLDIRVAFSEGFGNAYSGITTGDSVYRDSDGNGQSTGFSFDVDSNNCTVKGWFNECSVQAIIYDLYDNGAEVVDTINLGFAPLFSVLANEYKNSDAMTSVFSFIHELKENHSADASAIDVLVADQDIDAITDVYGDSEVSNNPGVTDMLPVHGVVIPNGSAVNVCSTDEFQVFNGLGVSRFLRFNMPVTGTVTIKATKTSGLGNDPDIYLYHEGQVRGIAETTTTNTETLTTSFLLSGRTYVVEVFEFANLGPGAGTTCFDITVTL